MFVPFVLHLQSNRHYWRDDLDRWLWRVHGNFGIRWYGLSYVAGFAVIYLLFQRWAKEGRLTIGSDDVTSLLLFAGFSGIIGARFGEFLFYRSNELIHHPMHFLDPRIGGMSAHGVCSSLLLLSGYLPIEDWLIVGRFLMPVPWRALLQ